MTLAEQLACVEREIKLREFAYQSGARPPELVGMRAVAETLRGLIDEVNMNEERLP